MKSLGSAAGAAFALAIAVSAAAQGAPDIHADGGSFDILAPTPEEAAS